MLDLQRKGLNLKHLKLRGLCLNPTDFFFLLKRLELFSMFWAAERILGSVCFVDSYSNDARLFCLKINHFKVDYTGSMTNMKMECKVRQVDQ